ncbi:uncharacterized protein L201_000388 [Kwoniella dendrophila CBS 6074]|uniref:Uncharacterized protein n=1 Tax=Kwoniella dendrophila CBS 6074 TaxID=1295534 RepID=A0AAX4JL87_9TREE
MLTIPDYEIDLKCKNQRAIDVWCRTLLKVHQRKPIEITSCVELEGKILQHAPIANDDEFRDVSDVLSGLHLSDSSQRLERINALYDNLLKREDIESSIKTKFDQLYQGYKDTYEPEEEESYFSEMEDIGRSFRL